MSISNFRMFKALVFILLVVGFILFCSVGVLQNGGSDNKTLDEHQAAGNLKHVGVIMGKLNGDLDHPKLDLHFMMKRRVPNGPDPIHNRRAGKTHRPPGRA